MTTDDEREHNGTVQDRRPDTPRWAYWVLALFVCGLIVAGGGFYKASHTASVAHRAAVEARQAAAKASAAARTANRAEDRSIDGLRGAAFRLCQRGDNDRAFAHSFARNPAELHHLQQTLPILDCTPNLAGGPARPLSPAAQADFVRRFVADKLTDAERGICTTPIGNGGLPCRPPQGGSHP